MTTAALLQHASRRKHLRARYLPFHTQALTTFIAKVAAYILGVRARSCAVADRSRVFLSKISPKFRVRKTRLGYHSKLRYHGPEACQVCCLVISVVAATATAV